MNSIGVRVFVVLLVSLASFVVGLVSEKNDFVERLMWRFNHAVAPRVTAEDNDDTASRALLASILGQTGLSPLDIPELSFASSNGQALTAVLLNEKRREILRALPLIAPAQGWFASGFGLRIDPMTRRVAGSINLQAMPSCPESHADMLRILLRRSAIVVRFLLFSAP